MARGVESGPLRQSHALQQRPLSNFSFRQGAAINGGFGQALALDGDFAIHQKVELGQFVHEGACAEHRLFELLAERQNALGRVGRIGARKKRLAFAGCNLARRVVKAKRQVVALRRKARQHERITAHESRDILAGLPLVIGTEKEIIAFLQADQRERGRIIAQAENDGVMTLDDGEFIDGDRNCVGLAGEGKIVALLQPMGWVELRRQRHEPAVKQRQGLFGRVGGRAGHGVTSFLRSVKLD
jgi:hypothetical protein